MRRRAMLGLLTSLVLLMVTATSAPTWDLIYDSLNEYTSVGDVSLVGAGAGAGAGASIDRGDNPCYGGDINTPPDMPGWPLELTTWRPTDGGVLVQADADPELEVLFSSARTTKTVYLMNHDGTHLPGWPKTLPTGAYARWGVSFGDLDGDGLGEVVATSDNQPNGSLGWTHAYHTDGTVVTGFPVLTHGDHLRPPTVVDLDGDGRAEIIVSERSPSGSSGKLYVIDGAGNVLPGWPFTVNHVPAASAGAGDLDGDGVKEIIFPSYASLYAIHLDGTVVDGWPMTPTDGSDFAHSSPVLADADRDGELEIAIGTQQFFQDYGTVYLLNGDGTDVDGWPIDTNKAIAAPPTFADLDLDGDLEIVVGENWQSICPLGYIFAWHADGSTVAGFPFGPVHAVQAQIAVGDIDGDSLPELIWDDSLEAGGIGWLNACHADGTPIDGWPLVFVGTPVFNTVSLGDVDLDGDVELFAQAGVAGDEGATIFLWDMPGDPTTIQMSMYQYGPGRDGLYNGPPVVGVPPAVADLPLRLSAYPNPFNPHVTLRYVLDRPGRVTIGVYDVAGRLVRRLADDVRPAGAGRVVWDGLDAGGAPAGSGTYVARVERAGASTSTPIVLVK